MRNYSIEQTARKYAKEHGFLSFARKYKKQLLDTGLDFLKTDSKKIVHKASEFIGNEIADKIVKQKHVIHENSRNVEEITILSKSREEILNELRRVSSTYDKDNKDDKVQVYRNL